MTGMIHTDDLRDLLHQAMLGLSRMQIYTVISEAEVNAEMHVAYMSFIPRAVGIIRSMLSFEKCILKESKATTEESKDKFLEELDNIYAGCDEELPVEEFLEKLAASNMLDGKELNAVKTLLNEYGDTIPVE